MQLVIHFDGLIKKVVTAVKQHLPPPELEKIKSGTYTCTKTKILMKKGALQLVSGDTDLTDPEATFLYKKLLTLPPQEVEQLINRSFKNRS